MFVSRPIFPMNLLTYLLTMIATITSLTIHANYQHYRVCQKISRVQKKKPQSLQGSAKSGLLTIIQNCYYFASAAVAVDSSHITASSSALWSRFSPPSNFGNGHVSTMWFMFCRWPQSQEGDWARPHLCKLTLACVKVKFHWSGRRLMLCPWRKWDHQCLWSPT